MKSRKTPAKAERGAQPVATAPRTEGQRLLLAVTGSQAEIAATLDVAKSAVGFWRRGAKTPGPAARAKLKAAYGIDPRAWEQPPGERPPAPATPAPPTTEVPTKPPPPPRSPRARTMTLDEVVAELDYLHDLRRDGDLMPSEKVRLSDSISKNLALKARLERDKELLEDRIVREHPMWVMRIKPSILAALKPFPEAMRAVADALAEVGE